MLSTPADLGRASGGFVAGEVAVLATVAAAGGSAGRSGDAPPFGNAPVSEVPELGANAGANPGNGKGGRDPETGGRGPGNDGRGGR